jgi:hypothetical protein
VIAGYLSGASAIAFNCTTDPAVLETLACREAVALAKDLGLSRIRIAFDCKTTVSGIANGSWGKYGAIISVVKGRSSLF